MVLESKEIDLGSGQTTRVLSAASPSVLTSAKESSGRSDANADTALRTLTPGMTYPDWKAASGLKGGTFERAKKRLLENARVLREGKRYYQNQHP
jgi:hypothetical protein